VKTEAPFLPGFQSSQIFSGFDSKYRVELQEAIFNIVWFGEGRWNWKDIYEMPIFLRKFWIRKINSIVEDQQAVQQRRSKNIK